MRVSSVGASDFYEGSGLWMFWYADVSSYGRVVQADPSPSNGGELHKADSAFIEIMHSPSIMVCPLSPSLSPRCPAQTKPVASVCATLSPGSIEFVSHPGTTIPPSAAHLLIYS